MYQVLMPIDGSKSRGGAQAETVKALPNATDDVQVTLLYVFDDVDREDSTSPSQISGGHEAYTRLRDGDIPVKQLSRIGDPATEILAAADEVDADLIVVGGRKRSPLGSLLFGSVTQAVILDAERPVTITGGEK